MNKPDAFEPFVNNIELILKREIPTPIMYEHLPEDIWNLKKCLRQSYAILTPTIHQKQHPIYTLYKPFYSKKKRSSSSNGQMS